MKKYEIVFQDLEQAIRQGKFSDNPYLPSEKELSQIYLVSRDTIRKALDKLAQERLIRKRQGQAAKVLSVHPIDFPVSALTSYQEVVQQQGLISQTNVIALDKVFVDEKLHEMTGFPLKTLIWRITRQRVVDGIASVLDIDYLDKKIVPHLTREIAQSSIYAYLEGQLGLKIAYARKEIAISSVTESDKILLDLGRDKHVVQVSSKVYLHDERQFQFTESRHKLDKFHFVDFAKRH